MKRMFIVAVMLVFGLGTFAMAGPPRPDGPGDPDAFGGPMGHGPELLQTWFELNLDDAQKKKAAGILKAHRQEILDAREDVREAFEQAREFGPKPGTFDEAALRKGHALICGAILEEMVLRERVLGELYAVLSPEQQQILANRMCPPRGPEQGRPGPDQGDKSGPGEHAREDDGPGGPGHHGPERGLPLLDAFIEAFG